MAHRLKQRLDYDDLARTPENGQRHELLDGKLCVTPSPNVAHQRASKRLLRRLEDYFEGHGLGEVFHAPTDVILTPYDVVVPDLLVVVDPNLVSARAIEGPPLLAVEILSPSTRKFDTTAKAERYAALGIRHYWIVDPEARSVECFRTESGRYREVTRAEGNGSLTHVDFPELLIDLTELWK